MKSNNISDPQKTFSTNPNEMVYCCDTTHHLAAIIQPSGKLCYKIRASIPFSSVPFPSRPVPSQPSSQLPLARIRLGSGPLPVYERLDLLKQQAWAQGCPCPFPRRAILLHRPRRDSTARGPLCRLLKGNGNPLCRLLKGNGIPGQI